jgi:carbon storage regulator
LTNVQYLNYNVGNQKWTADDAAWQIKEGEMLVLSRKKNEALVVDDSIRVVVLGIANGSVRIGIEAPDHVPVHRGEVHQRIQAEQLGISRPHGY